jgi:NAD(P)-dependent dehydrogenase (short-subunit alcohol dehydrogenase family)
LENDMAEHDFTDKVALVTGGGSGIGEACAMTFARSGAKVIVADFDKDGGDRVTEAIRAESLDATFVEVDVSKPEQIEAMVAESVETYGGLHVAVNNAGIGGAQALTGEYPIDSWQQVIEVNLSGVFYCMRHEIPAMLNSGGGAIVNMASILGSVGFANSAAYVAAKHGVVGLTKTAAIEYSAQGIRVNSVGPGFINTPLLAENLDDETLKVIAGMHPIGRLGEAQEVADLVAFLGSDEASFCTGGYYLVDGAYTAN